MKTHTESVSIGSSPPASPNDQPEHEGGESPSARTVTRLLRAWTQGDRDAADRLFAHVYAELRRLAGAQRRRWRTEGSLDSTALVHDAYLKLVGGKVPDLRGRAHFFALAARAMRQILLNGARRRNAAKRGDGGAAVSLSALVAEGVAGVASGSPGDEQLAALDEALTALEAISPRQCRVVECRFFAGLSIPETALALDVSDATVKRDWALAQAWLYRALHDDGSGE
jgi:RNA polymerase sigma factor (TIGR02999 family)